VNPFLSRTSLTGARRRGVRCFSTALVPGSPGWPGGPGTPCSQSWFPQLPRISRLLQLRRLPQLPLLPQFRQLHRVHRLPRVPRESESYGFPMSTGSTGSSTAPAQRIGRLAMTPPPPTHPAPRGMRTCILLNRTASNPFLMAATGPSHPISGRNRPSLRTSGYTFPTRTLFSAWATRHRRHHLHRGWHLGDCALRFLTSSSSFLSSV
jgi:hypothetical protein